MKKAFVVLSALVFLFICSCCTLHSNTSFTEKQIQDSRRSFVFIASSAKVKFSNALLGDNAANILSKTLSGKIATGSGVIVAHGPTYSLVLTAGHLCDKARYDAIFQKRYFLYSPKVLEINLVTFDIFGKGTRTTILGFDKSLDACMLKTARRLEQPAVPFAHRTPKIGETVLNVAAPESVYRPGMVPFFIGQYVGQMTYPDNRYSFSTFNFFVAGGSSGSPVFDQHGRLVTIIIGAQKVEHIPVGPPLPALRDYVYDYFRKQKEILITH